MFITLGTGVGTGIIINGKPWVGFHGVASEIGHTIMVIDGEPCTCGKDACLERYCSATALIRMGKEMCMAHPDCDVMQRIDGNLELLNAKIIIDSAKAGILIPSCFLTDTLSIWLLHVILLFLFRP